MWDLTPGFSLGGIASGLFGYAAPRVVDQAITGDADWIPGVSVKGGERTTNSPVGVGKTATPQQPSLGSTNADKYWRARTVGGHTNTQQQPVANGAFNGTGSGYVGGGASGPSYNQATVDQFDSGISALEAAMGRLPNQLNIARANVKDQYRVAENRLNSSRTAAEKQYGQSSTGNMQSLRTNKNNILDQQSQGLRGLLRTLGMYGAVGSDATLASEAVANEATRQRSGAGSVFAQNQQALDTNWGNFKIEDKERREELGDWRTKQLKTAEQQSAQTKQDLLSRLAELRGQRAATIGGSYSGAAQPYLDRANALSSRIDSLGRFKPTFDGKTPVYQAPSLDSYNVGAGPTIDAGGQPQAATPTLNALLGLGNDDEERRF